MRNLKKLLLLPILLSVFLLGADAEFKAITLGNGRFSGEDLYDTNAIISPDGHVAQRGTSFASHASGYFEDRWAVGNSSVAVFTVGQSTDVPTVAAAGRLVPSSLLLDNTTSDTSIEAGDRCFLYQIVEGYRWARLAQRACVLSFWVKSTKTGTFCVALRNTGGDRSYVAEYTVLAANTWEFKSVSIAASPTGGTWNYASGIGVNVSFTLNAGSTFQTTAGAWQTGNYHATANQVNATDSTGNDFRVCGVQLEPGVSNTAFRARSYEQELWLCQRYYQKISYSNVTMYTAWYSGTAAEQDVVYSFVLPVKMRAGATGTLTGTWTKFNIQTGPSLGVTGPDTFYLTARWSAANFASGFYMDSSDDSLTFDAEL